MTTTRSLAVDTAGLPLMPTELRLPSIARLWPGFTRRADEEGWPAARLLAALAEVELADRARRRVERHLAEARLPAGKTLASFDFTAVPTLSKARVTALAAGDGWIDKYHLLILDDFCYARKGQAETGVLFELIAARYERRSLLVTANKPFGEWNEVFPDPAMTLAAVDRLVHRATILELNVESYRRRSALSRPRQPGRRADDSGTEREGPDTTNS